MYIYISDTLGSSAPRRHTAAAAAAARGAPWRPAGRTRAPARSDTHTALYTYIYIYTFINMYTYISSNTNIYIYTYVYIYVGLCALRSAPPPCPYPNSIPPPSHHHRGERALYNSSMIPLIFPCSSFILPLQCYPTPHNSIFNSIFILLYDAFITLHFKTTTSTPQGGGGIPWGEGGRRGATIHMFIYIYIHIKC